MKDLLGSIVYWDWMALGALLLVVEVFAPGAQFLWLGIAAILTGAVLLVDPSLGWELQLTAFAVLSVIAVVVGRKVVSRRQKPTDHPTLNRRGAGLVGTACTLTDATEGGRGRLRVADGTWAFTVTPPGENLAAGTRVVVVGVDGTTLVVRPDDGRDP